MGSSFQYIAREIDPKPYPGFTITDFLVYPELAKSASLEGKVSVVAFINKKGIPKNVYIMRGVFPSLDEAALVAVKKSRWLPAKNNGKRIGVWVTIPVVFKLK